MELLILAALFVFCAVFSYRFGVYRMARLAASQIASLTLELEQSRTARMNTATAALCTVSLLERRLAEIRAEQNG